MNDFEEPSWRQARQMAHSRFTRLAHEEVKISEAIGRVAFHDIHSLCDLPFYTTSAMDGYVVAGDGPWRITGKITAGKPLVGSLPNNEAVTITTGAVIPTGSLGVLRWEDARVDGEILYGVVSDGQDIRPAALEAQIGETLIYSGTTLSPSHIGLLAASGHDSIIAIKKPRVAFITFGDELLFSGLPHSALVRDSLGPQIPSWISLLGAEVTLTLHVDDDLQEVIKTLASLVNEFDIIVTTGGTADGPLDFLRKALFELSAQLVVDRVKARPGHPMMLAAVKNIEGVDIPIVGLPGNPQSAIVALFTLGEPIICALLGKELRKLIPIKTLCALTAPNGFSRLYAGNCISGEFTASEYLGSAMLRGLANSNGLAVAPSGQTQVGEVIEWLPFPWCS